jgi:flagellar protein FliJ
MARFVYRLQKVYELRERHKKEQEQRVNEAVALTRKAEVQKQAKLQEIQTLVEELRRTPPMMMEMGIKYKEKLKEQLVQLEEVYQDALRNQQAEEAKLAEAHQALEALEKHKEKCKEEWQEEQKIIEMKQLDEVGSQRYFRMMVEAAHEAELAGEG